MIDKKTGRFLPGHIIDEKTKRKIIKALTGRPVSEETREKIRISNLKNITPKERKIRSKRRKDWWKYNKTNNPQKIEKMKEKISSSQIGRTGLKMEKSPKWKGGRRICGRDGYVFIHKPDHPFCRKDGDILEHRLVMEKMIGRYLKKGEDVHHKNGKKDDNRPGNLMLVSHFKHFSEHGCPKCGFKTFTH